MTREEMEAQTASAGRAAMLRSFDERHWDTYVLNAMLLKVNKAQSDYARHLRQGSASAAALLEPAAEASAAVQQFARNESINLPPLRGNAVWEASQHRHPSTARLEEYLRYAGRYLAMDALNGLGRVLDAEEKKFESDIVSAVVAQSMNKPNKKTWEFVDTAVRAAQAYRRNPGTTSARPTATIGAGATADAREKRRVVLASLAKLFENTPGKEADVDKYIKELQKLELEAQNEAERVPSADRGTAATKAELAEKLAGEMANETVDRLRARDAELASAAAAAAAGAAPASEDQPSEGGFFAAIGRFFSTRGGGAAAAAAAATAAAAEGAKESPTERAALEAVVAGASVEQVPVQDIRRWSQKTPISNSVDNAPLRKGIGAVVTRCAADDDEKRPCLQSLFSAYYPVRGEKESWGGNLRVVYARSTDDCLYDFVIAYRRWSYEVLFFASAVVGTPSTAINGTSRPLMHCEVFYIPALFYVGRGKGQAPLTQADQIAENEWKSKFPSFDPTVRLMARGATDIARGLVLTLQPDAIPLDDDYVNKHFKEITATHFTFGRTSGFGAEHFPQDVLLYREEGMPTLHLLWEIHAQSPRVFNYIFAGYRCPVWTRRADSLAHLRRLLIHETRMDRIANSGRVRATTSSVLLITQDADLIALYATGSNEFPWGVHARIPTRVMRRLSMYEQGYLTRGMAIIMALRFSYPHDDFKADMGEPFELDVAEPSTLAETRHALSRSGQALVSAPTEGKGAAAPALENDPIYRLARQIAAKIDAVWSTRNLPAAEAARIRERVAGEPVPAGHTARGIVLALRAVGLAIHRAREMD